MSLAAHELIAAKKIGQVLFKTSREPAHTNVVPLEKNI